MEKGKEKKKRDNFLAKIEKKTYKKNKFKAQLVWNGLKGGTEIDRVD